jgi:DNA-binding beta-propeller fold protein YncE
MNHRLSLLVMLFASTTLGACSVSAANPAASVVAGANARSKAVGPRWIKRSLGTFADPYGVAVVATCKSSCDVYVADPGSKTIWKVAPDGTKSSVGSFSAAGSSFDPQSVAVSNAGFIYVADKAPGAKSVVWEVTPDGRTTPVAGFVSWRDDYFRGVGLAYSNGAVASILATDALRNRNGSAWFYTSCCSYRARAFGDPYAVAGDGVGNAYVADALQKRIYRLPYNNRAGPVAVGRAFVDPYGVAATLDGQYVYVADAGDKRVWEIAPDGTSSVVENFADPYGVAVDAAGDLYVADPGSKNVWKLTR